MPIDITTPDSPGFWMARLSRELYSSERQRRFEVLEAWYKGDPPLPEGASAARSAFLAFQRFARSNFAALIVEALRERMRQRGIRTSTDGAGSGREPRNTVFRSGRFVWCACGGLSPRQV